MSPARVHALPAGFAPVTSSAQERNSAATTPEQRAHIEATADTSHGIAFSRSTGLPARMGKSTEDCKTKLPFAIKADVMRASHSLGMTESEWVRLVVMEKLYGAAEVQRMHLAHIQSVVGMGPVAGLTAEGQS